MKAALRKRLFYLCRLLGIDEDTRHAMQYEITGKESLTRMTESDINTVVNHLETIAKQNGYLLHTRKGHWKNKLPKGKNIYNLMTNEQRRKIIALSMQLYDSFSEEQMNIYCLNHFNKPFRRLSSSEAIKLIEAQKSMLKRRMS
ncbi:MAG: hypothetical protein Kow00102_14150 [Spirochaetota bacterium]|nr:regulatory protein GemA [Spirochaetota bacterium]